MPDLPTCPACRSAQRRRGDPLCPSCARSAAEPVPDPLWALDSPLLRRALAEANMPAVLAVTRAACGGNAPKAPGPVTSQPESFDAASQSKSA